MEADGSDGTEVVIYGRLGQERIHWVEGICVCVGVPAVWLNEVNYSVLNSDLQQLYGMTAWSNENDEVKLIIRSHVYELSEQFYVLRTVLV